MNRRAFVQSLTSLLTFLGFARTVDAQPAPEFQWQFYPPLDGPITGRYELGGRVYIFTERSVYDAGPI